MGAGSFQQFDVDGGTILGKEPGVYSTDTRNFYITAAIALVTVVSSIVGLSSGYALVDPQVLVYLVMGSFGMYGLNFLFAPKMFCELHFNMKFDLWHAFISRMCALGIFMYLAAMYLLDPLTATRLNTGVLLAVTFTGPYYVQAFMNTKALHWSAPLVMSPLLVLHAFSFGGNPSVHTVGVSSSGVETYAQAFLLFSFVGAMGYCLQLLFTPSLFWRTMGLEGHRADPLTEWLLAWCFAGWGVGKLACALAGYEPTVLFCGINLLPMLLLALWAFRSGANLLVFLPGNLIFIIGYSAVVVSCSNLSQLTVPLYTLGQKYLLFSAVGAAMFGIAYEFFPATLAALLGAKRKDFDTASFRCVAVSCIGWSAGKLACALSGRNATLLFCWINLVPMFALLGHDIAERTPAAGIFPRLVFIAGYIAVAVQDLLHQPHH